ncbi:MAG TPA: hypothetical protein VMK12_04875, partial [Anaeromyxobacteraceae bacterium]|nr:hypothetical protein [Anaeromyxobacteraceae bacterium]
FVPDAKVRYAITDQLAAYGDLGLGLALLHTSLDLGASSMPAAFTIQVGGGIAVALSSELNFLAEIRFNMYTKTGEATLIAFPTIGLEYH